MGMLHEATHKQFTVEVAKQVTQQVALRKSPEFEVAKKSVGVARFSRQVKW